MNRKYSIDVSDQETILGKEFYLAVVNHERREAINRNIPKSGLDKLKDFLASLGRRQVRSFDDYDGSMIEVVTRQPSQVEGYMWPSIDTITYDDGTPLGRFLSSNGLFATYLFVPDSVRIVGESFLMSGQARDFNLGENRLGNQLEQRINVRYEQVPTEKVTGSISSFFTSL